MSGIPLEIEKKYLVNDKMPDPGKYNSKKILQGYITENGDSVTVRLRRKGEQFFLTVKTRGNEIRGEAESEISKEQFDTFWPLTLNKRVEKVRYEIPYGKHIIELDIYYGRLEGLITAEVEFENKEQLNNFIPPGWFDKDVSADIRYRNQFLAVKGIPEQY